MTNEKFAHYLQRLGITELNELQETVLKSSQNNKDNIVLSATGSGKTLAFLLPIIESLQPDANHVQALILVPSRELALQIEGVVRKMQIGVKVLACYGGHKREIEENSLTETPAIIIGTAGRMADHLRRENVNFKDTQYLILDEFDKMLELGFVEEMKYILGHISSKAHKMLTSATFTESIPDFVKMDTPELINFLDENQPKEEDLRIHTIVSSDKDKLPTLLQFISFARDTSTIVFANHRESVERVSTFLSDEGVINVFYHGGMEQRDREVALTKFKNGTSQILVTTDLASRGLDIENIRNIVHYHIPDQESSFTHRNGRTARMGKTGNVYVIHHEEEKLPAYIKTVSEAYELPENVSLPEKPKWSTLYIDAGKKNKISKGDIAGFFMQKGELKKDDLGLIEVKDFLSFAAVRKSKVGAVLEAIKHEKLKGKKILIGVAK